MSILFTIGAFLVVFSILVLAHEFGHFIVAKRAGVKVEEFGFGLPPRIWGKRKGETLYSINAIPFGGFVRLLGEGDDGSKKKAGKDASRSFAAQSRRTQAKILVAGVTMNIILAWAIISVGFMVGMEPMLGPNDVLTAVDDGRIVLENGAAVKEVVIGSLAEKAGFKVGDSVVAIDGNEVNMPEQIVNALAGFSGKYTVSSDNGLREIVVTSEEALGAKEFGLKFYDAVSFPRLKIYSVETGSLAYQSGLRGGDVVLSVDGKGVYSTDGGLKSGTYEVYRDGEIIDIYIDFGAANKVIISGFGGSDLPAEKAGILPGDIIVAVDGKFVSSPEEVIKYVAGINDARAVSFAIDRHGKMMYFDIQSVNGKVGVYLSRLVSGVSPGVGAGVSAYITDQYTSVLEIEDQKYPIYSAPFYALAETYRLTETTFSMFGDFISGLVSSGEVPENVAGPVGIAQMSGSFAREGLIPLLRFIAILSISLAVVNILPFPALDGGKLLFIFVEFLFGKKIPTKFENYIHLVGYSLILLLIIAVTYRDILRII